MNNPAPYPNLPQPDDPIGQSQMLPPIQAPDVPLQPQDGLPGVNPSSFMSGGTSSAMGGSGQPGGSAPIVPIPENASDGDLIEKEWVVKAKQIVEHTQEDPFTQQEELSKMKAAYIKKRYNKDLGVK